MREQLLWALRPPVSGVDIVSGATDYYLKLKKLLTGSHFAAASHKVISGVYN